MNQSIISHYFKRAIRELRYFKLNTFINIIGLTLGITACLLIIIYVRYETSFDKHSQDFKNIYRLTCTTKAENGEIQNWAMTPSAYSQAFKESFPEVVNSARALRSAQHTLSYKENNFKSKFIIFTDSTFFDLLSYPLEIGDVKTALRTPNGIVLTHKSAQKLFGNENPLNKIVSN